MTEAVPPAIPFRPVAELLPAYAARHPKKTAIFDIDGGRGVSFAELDRTTARIASHLIATGIATGDKLVILSDECLEKLLLLLGVWRAGGVACPFHMETSAAHLRLILGTIAPRLVLWNAALDGPALTAGLACASARFAGFPAGEFFVDLPPAHAGAGRANGPDDLACIFSTSGTTDRPKCVGWDHLGLWLCGLSTIGFTGMTADDRILDYRTFSWLSPQIVTLMPFLALGLTIHVARRFSHSQFFDWIKSHGITVAAGVPTVINMLLSKPVAITAAELPTLRLMTSSSAPLAPEQWAAFEDRYGIRVLQFYGASEGGWHTGNRFDKFRRGTVGPMARHMDLAIVDAEGQVRPPGVEGEITIRGRQTAALTISPDGEIEDRRPFRLTRRTRTGDLGVIDADGFVTVTGRVKDLIIRGGVNIAPLEIDAVLMTHPMVHEAAAIGIPDPIYGEEVAAYVVAKEGCRPSESELAAHAARHLPAIKTPKRIYLVDALPKSERGKVKRDILRERWARENSR